MSLFRHSNPQTKRRQKWRSCCLYSPFVPSQPWQHGQGRAWTTQNIGKGRVAFLDCQEEKNTVLRKSAPLQLKFQRFHQDKSPWKLKRWHVGVLPSLTYNRSQNPLDLNRLKKKKGGVKSTEANLGWFTKQNPWHQVHQIKYIFTTPYCWKKGFTTWDVKKTLCIKQGKN